MLGGLDAENVDAGQSESGKQNQPIWGVVSEAEIGDAEGDDAGQKDSCWVVAASEAASDEACHGRAKL